MNEHTESRQNLVRPVWYAPFSLIDTQLPLFFSPMDLRSTRHEILSQLLVGPDATSKHGIVISMEDGPDLSLALALDDLLHDIVIHVLQSIAIKLIHEPERQSADVNESRQPTHLTSQHPEHRALHKKKNPASVACKPIQIRQEKKPPQMGEPRAWRQCHGVSPPPTQSGARSSF